MSFTIGASGGSQVTNNFDALVSTTLVKYRKKLIDAISTSNAFFYELKRAGLWESQDGGLYIAQDLMYELGNFDSYDGYDELSDLPTDGITQVQFQWRQGASAISYSEKERKMNKHRILDLVQAKIKQCEMGFTEGFNKALLQGSISQGSGGSLVQPYQSVVNNSYFIDPLPRMIAYDPTASLEIGNLNQSTYTWWRNKTKECTATTYLGLLQQLDTLFNDCSKGPGGTPKLAICDQTTFELINAAYYAKYQTQASNNADYPFDNIKFRGCTITWDEYVPDVYSGVASTATYGTLWFINPQFFKMIYEKETNFEMTPFAKPPKGDSRLAHVLFMGQSTISNRKKHGVMGKIPRTLTA